jgi:hypothetical protein
MQLRVAQLSDIDETLALHYRYQIVSIADEDKKDGFVTTLFTNEELADLINYEMACLTKSAEHNALSIQADS